MHLRSAFSLLLPLLALAATPAVAQNLLVNPGFNRDLGGWAVSTSISSTTLPPDLLQASATWTASDASRSITSGGLALHAKAFTGSSSSATATQCVAAFPGTLARVGARILTTRQLTTSSASVVMTFFSTADCSGASLARTSAPSLPSVLPETSSDGLWLLTTTQALVSPGSHSVLAEVSVQATGTFAYGQSEVIAVADDAFLTLAAAGTTTWILPSAAWVHGATGSYWTTQFTLSNPGTTDAAVTLKWLGHDTDGRGGHETAYVVRAGQTLVPDEGTWSANFPENWGAIFATSSSPALIMQSETSTPVPGGGTVGESLPAVASANLIGSAARSIAPVRDDISFRTNLVLANAVEFPITVQVALFAADGAPAGSRDVPLPPLGATQINRVAAALGASGLEAGRLSLSTPTPGGLFAAYVSVIDNVSNDPRAFLPDATAASRPPSTNLLSNPGFDRGLDGWALKTGKSGNGTTGSGWSLLDSRGSAESGSAGLSANAPGANPSGDSAFSSLSQCVGVSADTAYSLRASVTANVWGFFSFPRPGIFVQYYGSGDCTGASLGDSGVTFRPFFSTDLDDWHTESTSFAASPEGSRTALVSLSAGAGGSVHGAGISAAFDDVFFGTAPSVWEQLLPSCAHIRGENGSFWTTDLTIGNPGTEDATVFFLSRSLVVPAGRLLGVPDVLGDPLGYHPEFGPVRVVSTSPGVTVQSQTFTPLRAGGTAGTGLAAVAAGDLIGTTPKNLVPIRESRSFRTNLVLVNAVEIPVTVRVELLADDGTSLGQTDVELPGLAMKQINQVAGSFGFWDLEVGRLSVSTDTPGGNFAAYASVIDNVTNDPRTILPR